MMKKYILGIGISIACVTNFFAQQNPAVTYSTVTTSQMVPYVEPATAPTTTRPNFIGRGNAQPFDNSPHQPDLVWQQNGNMEKASTATLQWSFDGQGTNMSPPDPSGDADATVYIQGTNGATGGIYRVFNKTTGAAVTASMTMATLGGAAGLGDPIILYHKPTQQWIITEFASGGNNLLVHVSPVGTYTGTYTTSSFACTSFPDYPKYAIYPGVDALVVTSNEGNPYISAMKLSALLAGTPSPFIRTFAPALGGFGFQSITPVDLEGDNPFPAGQKPMFIRHRDDEVHGGPATAGVDYIEVWEATINWVGNTISVAKTQDIGIAEIDSDLCGLTSFACFGQPGTANTLDPLRETVMYKPGARVFTDHQAIALALTTDVNGLNRGGIRWIELRRATGSVGAWTKYQEGTYSPGTTNRWMPAINMDKYGNILVAYSTSSTTAGDFPSLKYTGRKPCDPLGTMTIPEGTIVTGLSSRTSNTRWGDYFHMSIDPYNEETFYFTGDYMAATNSLRTRICAIKINREVDDAKLVSAALVTPTPICTNAAVVALTVQNFGSASLTAGTIKYQINGGAFTDQLFTSSLITDATTVINMNLTGVVNGVNLVKFVVKTANLATPDNYSCNDTLTFSFTGAVTTMSLSSVTTPATCGANNGTVTATVLNGTTNGSPLSYSNNGGTGQATGNFTALAAGGYIVIVTDPAGCTATAALATVASTSSLAATQSQVNVLCFGASTGSGTVVASGGTAPYTYLWSVGGTTATRTGLSTGTFTCTISDNAGCSIVKTFTITGPAAAISNTNSQVNVACFGGATGSATVVVSGGTAPYTYSWTGGGTAATKPALIAGSYTVTITDANLCTATQLFTITAPAAALATTGTQVNVLCFGGATGSATVSVTGGTGPYTYSWTGGGTAATKPALIAGTYTVTVTDANLCTTSLPFTITGPAAALATTGTQVNVLCFGGSTGSATVSVTGGTGPYTYSWTGGGTAATKPTLIAGTYTVTVTDANLCTTTRPFTITQAASALSATSSSTNATCGSTNGTATVVASGGTGAYTYSWAPSGGTAATASALAAGSYTCTITDANGCTFPKVVAVAATGGATVTVPTFTNVSCFGGNNGSATVTVSGGTTPYTYLWSPSGGTGATASGLIAGSYTCAVTTASGCVTNGNITITQPLVLAVSTAQTHVACVGQTNGTASSTVTGGTLPYVYSWSNATSAVTLTNVASGPYTLNITDNKGCTASSIVTIASVVKPTLTPSATNITFFGASNGIASVVASAGLAPYTYVWSPSGGTAASASPLAAGAYSVVVTDANGCTQTTSSTIVEPAAIGVTAVITNASAFGGSDGSIVCTATGGTGVYQYSINNGVTFFASNTFTGLIAGTYSIVAKDANGCTVTISGTITQPTSMVLTAIQTNSIICNGDATGAISASAVGGTAPLAYSIDGITFGASGNFTNLIAGTYTVTVRDANNFTTTQNVTIAQPSAVTVVISSQTNVLCNGLAVGSVFLNATGGNSPYTYSSNNITFGSSFISGLSAGGYTFYAKDVNNCLGTITGTITEPSAITATSTLGAILCNNGTGTIQVSAVGGTGSLSYSLNGVVNTTGLYTNLVQGVYNTIVSDASGCSIIVINTLTQPNALVLNATPTAISCFGANNGSIQAIGSGGTAPLQYSIDGMTYASASNFTGLIAGTYVIFVKDANNCTTSFTTSVGEPTLLTISAVGTTVTNTNDGTITITANGGTSPYQYSIDGINYSANTLFSNLTGGSYTCYVKDDNGCIATTTVILGDVTGLADNQTPKVNVTALFPNPTVGEFTINLEDVYDDVKLKIFNTEGRLIAYFTIQNTKGSVSKTFELGKKIAPGVYFLGIYEGTKEPRIMKIEKQ